MRLTNFYIPGVELVCRFCETPIVNFSPTGMKPLGNHTHMTVQRSDSKPKFPTFWRFTCGKSCSRTKAVEHLQEAFNAERELHGFDGSITVLPETLKASV